MADYNAAFQFILNNEDSTRSGVVTPDPTNNDPSAIARFGINSAAHPEAVKDGFYQMPVDKALEYAEVLYKYAYWVGVSGYQVIVQDVANKIFDLAVNAGTVQAVKIAQRAANHCLAPAAIGYMPLAVDGICGPETVEALNAANPEELLPSIKDYACQFYRDVANRRKWPLRQLDALLTRANR